MSLIQSNNIHYLLGIDFKHLRADEFLNVRLQWWTSMGVYEEKPGGGELIIPFSSKFGFCSNESIISHDSRIILIIIFIISSKMWRNKTKTL